MCSATAAPEAIVDNLIHAGQTGKAVRLLYQLSVESAKNRDFIRSEGFRDRIYEVDSMALDHIIAVNEIIEREKSKAITTDHRRLWARFFEGLSADEANAFFLAMQERTFESETLVLEQGKPNSRLYFLSRGELKLTHHRQDKEMLIKCLVSGDFFGQETFFSVNVCTVAVKTLTRAHLRFLERADLDRLADAHPSLAANLEKICFFGPSIYDHLRQKGLERRAYKRIKLNAKVMFQLLSENTSDYRQAITAELWDISREGLSFYFHSKKPETVQSLIGRTLGVRFQIMIAGSAKTATVTGVVHGVQSHPLEEYSVHLKLNRPFSDQALRAIQTASLL